LVTPIDFGPVGCMLWLMTITLKRLKRFGRVDVAIVEPDWWDWFIGMTGRKNVTLLDLKRLEKVGFQFRLASEWSAIAPAPCTAEEVFQ